MKLESNTLRPELEDAPAKLLLLESSRYNSLRLHVSLLASAIAGLASADPSERNAAAEAIYRVGRASAEGGCFSLAE